MKLDALAAFHDWFDKRGVWPRLTYLEIFEAGYAAAQPYHDGSAKAEAESFDLRTRARLYKEQHAKTSA